MRADLYNRVAWQLRTRAGAEVYAWLPVLGYEPADPRQREEWAIRSPEADGIFRLDFTRPEVRRFIAGIYEDLAANSYMDGLLFHDDAFLSDFEDASPAALAAYRAVGLPGDIGDRAADRQRGQVLRRLADGLDDEGDRARHRVGVRDRERDPLGAVTQTDDHELPWSSDPGDPGGGDDQAGHVG